MLMVSILGDSISTYEGFCPADYSVFFQGQTLLKNGLRSVYDTWWAKVNQYLHACICVCNAYSGSCVSGRKFPSMSSDERTCNLDKDGYYPDLILIYGGINDFGSGVSIEGANNFQLSYAKMLQKLKKNYPDASIFCGTLMKTYIQGNEIWQFPEIIDGTYLDEYNAVIRKVAIQEGCLLADLASIGNKYETLDGTHPTYAGHQEIAQCWISALDNTFKNILKIKNKIYK